jgi:DNA-directed RNA polymerase subunit RPC12/RpoP
MPWECPACGAASDRCYRCSECGHDLPKADSTIGREETQ